MITIIIITTINIIIIIIITTTTGRTILNLTKLNPIKSSLVQLFALFTNDNVFGINDIENMVEQFSKSYKGIIMLMFILIAMLILMLVVMIKDMWNASWNADDLKEEIEKRKLLLDSTFFKYDERIALAKAIVLKYDSNYFYHCRIRNCNEKQCEFMHQQCPNAGCPTIVSKCWLTKHDNVCGYKVVNCTRNCGDFLCRKDMDNHLQFACIFRAVQCPFAELGCMAALKHNEVEGHLEECIQSHLLLSLNRIKEQQSVIISLHQKVKEYDLKIIKNTNDLITIGASVTAINTLVNEVDKKHTKMITDELKKNDAKSSKETNLAVGEFRTENSKIRTEINSIKGILLITIN